ncbi:hypothetical protein [Actinomycetospora straminea]|uniref:hypothetical protein n=1 Tax=Actinomycetospora straminea TaxID=663607 RepID=UPI003B671C84
MRQARPVLVVDRLPVPAQPVLLVDQRVDGAQGVLVGHGTEPSPAPAPRDRGRGRRGGRRARCRCRRAGGRPRRGRAGTSARSAAGTSP